MTSQRHPDALEFMSLLGGKYSEPEQVTPGLIQTFRARDLATGRPVLVHRISDLDYGEQNSLLKLLLSSLYRSPDVRKSVIDITEEGNDCYVMTEDIPQCFLLREWLQFENERPDGVKHEIARGASEESLGLSLFEFRQRQESAPAGTLQASEPAWTDPRSNEVGDERQPDNGRSDEISLPAFVSGPAPDAPQAAPMRSIEPLPPEFSGSRPAVSSSFISPPADISHEDASSPFQKETKQNTGEIPQEVPQTKFAAFLAADGGETFTDAQQGDGSERPNPEVQRPGGSSPLDEFSRLFADAGHEFFSADSLGKHLSQPDPKPVPVFASPAAPASAPSSAVPVESGWASTPGVFTGVSDAASMPVLPTAAQTVLESALAAQAESRKNRRLLIAVILVLLALAILITLLIVPKQ